MVLNPSLKPFVINGSDLDFLLQQTNFLPLFDVNGNAIVAWPGVGAIFDGYGNLIWNGIGLSPIDAMAQFGRSYAHITAFTGVRDVSGFNNNLIGSQATWGTVDQPFPRMVAANFEGYVKPLVDTNGAVDDPNVYYGEKGFAPSLSTPQADYSYNPLLNGPSGLPGTPDWTLNLQGCRA